MKVIMYILFSFLVSVNFVFSQGKGININYFRKAILNGQTETDPSPGYSSLKYDTIELKWDTSEPTGYMKGLHSKDTICVTFDPIPGGLLDSIKVALAMKGSVTGGVWELKKSGPSLLGTLLSDPFEVSITTTTDFPYPVPYTNWATVDLRSYNISTDIPFAVGFIVEKLDNAPGFMVTKRHGFYSFHSFTYLTPPGGSPGWYYLKPSFDSVYIYLIRAYVSTQFPTVVNDQSIIDEYSLSQNYPNPFNPETLIKYSIAEAANVRLKIINLLGETVSELINSLQSAGEHSVRFNAAKGNLSSGIYFYSLEVISREGARSFSSAKKLIYIK